MPAHRARGIDLLQTTPVKTPTMELARAIRVVLAVKLLKYLVLYLVALRSLPNTK
jgi:hypothetical protein